MKYLLSAISALILFSACQQKPNGDPNIELGADLYQDEEYDKALEELKKGIGKSFIKYSEAKLFTMIGNTFEELDEYDSSIVYHKKALTLDSSYVEAWVNLGIVYRQTSDYDEAEKCYLKAESLNPDYPELHASLGALYIYKDDAKKAIEHLERSIELDPQLEVAHSNYALALAMVGEFDKAEAELKKAVVMGYKNGAVIQERIDNLKELSKE